MKDTDVIKAMKEEARRLRRKSKNFPFDLGVAKDPWITCAEWLEVNARMLEHKAMPSKPASAATKVVS